MSKHTKSLLLKTECSPETPTTVAVIRAISSIEDVDPTTIAPNSGLTLFDHVDPEVFKALNSEESDDTDLVIEFSLYDYHICVENSQIFVYELE